MEEWKPIPDRPEYEASSAGRVRKGLRILSAQVKKKKQGNNLQRYSAVEFYRPYQRRYVHTLVLEAFVGPRPQGRQCRHLNGNSLDNQRINLAWGTARENTDDRIRHNPHEYLSDVERTAVIALLVLPHMTLRRIAAIIGCSKSTIGNIYQQRKALTISRAPA